ncbi:hypothetical protein RRG08_019107 [Elysia crispata]|uniref:Uncharacterized protein n=1 Tax=Elysia crispata TaxID=231223 RepID=A0AAE1A781_9GAST|nr:hypothetical protein RRG08_019107 [Elysia crispata]
MISPNISHSWLSFRAGTPPLSSRQPPRRTVSKNILINGRGKRARRNRGQLGTRLLGTIKLAWLSLRDLKLRQAERDGICAVHDVFTFDNI